MRKQGSQRQAEVLEVLQGNARPMTAYEILDKLKDSEAGLAPPTVYRALSALTEEGRAHRLESLNAFVPCQCAHVDHAPVLAICDDCGVVEEYADQDVMNRLTALARSTGFRAARHVVEVHGTCRACAA
ncbi:Fur family transcriptional regulator [Roseovarius aquimarinus]|uniref:Ferric uptake regulation protein n=1 Tax=Roseovarius aquimarinus TaxID=1229156 RepID=A0ABW7I4Y5_9RHOB